jgi:hypothetical protein
MTFCFVGYQKEIMPPSSWDYENIKTLYRYAVGISIKSEDDKYNRYAGRFFAAVRALRIITRGDKRTEPIERAQTLKQVFETLGGRDLLFKSFSIVRKESARNVLERLKGGL